MANGRRKTRSEKEHADIAAEQLTVRENYRLTQDRRTAATQAEAMSRRRYEEGIAALRNTPKPFTTSSKPNKKTCRRPRVWLT